MSNLSKMGTELQVMYGAKTNSPSSELVNSINDSQSTIELVDASVLPDAPNLLTIGEGEDAETCVYDGITGNVVNIVMRGFQGGAKAWDAGTPVARNFTAYDHDAFKQNLNSLGTSAVEDLSSDGGVVTELLTANRLVTVGSGGTYVTLQEAFDGEAHWNPGPYGVEIRMLSGYEISSGVNLTAGNFRHITLTGEDAVHEVVNGFTGDLISYNDVVGFTLDVLIDMKGLGRDGIRAVNSNFVVSGGAGVKNAGAFGIRATTCNFDASGSIFTGAGERGVNCVQLTNGNVNNSDLEGAGSHGLRVQALSLVSANNAMCRRGEEDDDNDVFITNGGIVAFGLAQRTGGQNVTPNELSSSGFILQ